MGALVIVLVVVYFMNSASESTDKPADKGDEKKVEDKLARDFRAAEEPKLVDGTKVSGPVGKEDPLLKAGEQELEKRDWKNSAAIEAEQLFRRGQREYLEKNYTRAIDSFTAALSLNRGHMLAEKYLRRAVYEAELEAKQNMEIGVKYVESLQYERALYHFQQVIDLMTHRPEEPIVAEARRYITLCKQVLQASEMFP